MSITAAQAHILLTLLHENTHHLSRLNELLEQERQCIETSDHQGLIALLDQKENLLDIIHQTENKLLQSLAQCGYALPFKQWINADGLARLAEQIPEALKNTFIQAWTNLKMTLMETSRLNGINRHVVEYSKYGVDHLLNILRGSQAHPVLYQASGRLSGSNDSHTLASA